MSAWRQEQKDAQRERLISRCVSFISKNTRVRWGKLILIARHLVAMPRNRNKFNQTQGGEDEMGGTCNMHGRYFYTAQAVSRWLPTAAARVRSRGLVKWDLWWTKWRWDRFFPEYFGFPCQSSFHQILQHHIHSGQV
jgi:hypothetical protein